MISFGGAGVEGAGKGMDYMAPGGATKAEPYDQSAPTKFQDLSGYKGIARSEVEGAHTEGKAGRAGVSVLGAAARSVKGEAAANAGVFQAGAHAKHKNWSASAEARALTAGAAAEAKGMHAEAGAEATVGKVVAKAGTGVGLQVLGQEPQGRSIR